MNNFIATLKQLGGARLIIMGGIMAGLLLFFGFVSTKISTPHMQLLYDNLSTTDSTAMASKLDEAHIPYEVSPDGARIQVGTSDVGKARMLLAANGLPNGGSMGYELFDKQSGFGTTNFVQNINQVRALEGELARTIGSLGPVRSARVHLVLPQRELFSRESRSASASVFLSLRPGASLDREQILSIQSLVSSAVPQLKPQGVSVIDSNGNLLARGGEETDTLENVKAEEMRRNYEQRTSTAVEDMIGRIVGYGHVRVNVTADLNFDRISTNEELYDPAGQVVRSTQTVEEKNKEQEAAAANTDVSLQNSLPGIAGDLGGAPSSENNRTEETTNYEVSRTVRSMVHEVGDVKRLSVAVLLDGTYTTDKDGKKTYSPRPQEQLDQISALVKSAIGYDEKRGDKLEVLNMQFADVEAEDGAIVDNRIMGFERGDLLDAAEIIIVSIVGLLGMMLVIKPMVGRVLTPSAPRSPEAKLEAELLAARPANPALTGPGGGGAQGQIASHGGGAQGAEDESMIDMSRVEGKVKASSVKKVEDIVNNYPAESVSVIRGWMSQES